MGQALIHSTAAIGSKAEIGKDVAIGPFAVIEDGAGIGDGCKIGPHVVIHRFTTVGEGCRIHAGAVLGDEPQDLAFKDVESYVRIGANCIIREGVTIHRGTKEKSSTEVGDECFLMALAHLAHNVRLGNRVVVTNAALLAGYVQVGDGAFISGMAGVHQFVRIGRLAMLGGGSIATKDVPPFCMLRTTEYNAIGGLNVVGLRRAGLTADQRKEIKRAFTLLYRSNLSVSDAITRIRETFTSGPALEVADFVDASERGICSMKQRREG